MKQIPITHYGRAARQKNLLLFWYFHWISASVKRTAELPQSVPWKGFGHQRNVKICDTEKSSRGTYVLKGAMIK